MDGPAFMILTIVSGFTIYSNNKLGDHTANEITLYFLYLHWEKALVEQCAAVDQTNYEADTELHFI